MEIKALLNLVEQAFKKQADEHEKEIKHLMKMLETGKPSLEAEKRKLVSKGLSAVKEALRRADSCSVYYCRDKKRFKVLTKSSHMIGRGLDEFVGTYTEGYSSDSLREDLFESLKGS